MRRAPAVVLLALALGLAVSACGGSSTPAAKAPAPAPAASSSAPKLRYVALGDSYTAAPYVYLTDVAGGCLRSNNNYPALLARRLGAALTDVSCGGATTKDLTAPQQTFGGQQVAPQLDVVTRDTQLVTIGIGGNDFGLFGSLSAGCPIVGPNGQQIGTPPTGGRCGQVDLATARRELAGVEKNVTVALQDIRTKAPDAKIVLVGYPRIASTTTTCPSVLPATLADEKDVDATTRGLRDAMRAAATTAGATFVDMYDASVGHDVCAGKAAWVNGIRTDTQRAAPLHPFAEEQQAVAALVAKAVGG